MKFGFVDRIIELERGRRIVAVKAVSLAEEYLGNHFPTFPVLPGVLMLQALAEAASWLVRDAQDFTRSVILLRSARNVTYKSFVRPGQLLRLVVTCRALGEEESEFDGVAYCDQSEMVKARFSLTHLPVGPREAGGKIEARITNETRARFALLTGPSGSLQAAREATSGNREQDVHATES